MIAKALGYEVSPSVAADGAVALDARIPQPYLVVKATCVPAANAAAGTGVLSSVFTENGAQELTGSLPKPIECSGNAPEPNSDSKEYRRDNTQKRRHTITDRRQMVDSANDEYKHRDQPKHFIVDKFFRQESCTASKIEQQCERQDNLRRRGPQVDQVHREHLHGASQHTTLPGEYAAILCAAHEGPSPRFPHREPPLRL